MRRIYSMDTFNASASNGIVVYHDQDFMGIVIFNMRSHYQIVKVNGVIGNKYNTLNELIQFNSLYLFYQL